ncbi:MAG: hypothetical protein EPO11_09725 [Gammaproteobacteria bacterium]|nr:MAG: hypothetical protein EPO11_09725 [Gammaproteobacteria bacterium]
MAKIKIIFPQAFFSKKTGDYATEAINIDKSNDKNKINKINSPTRTGGDIYNLNLQFRQEFNELTDEDKKEVKRGTSYQIDPSISLPIDVDKIRTFLGTTGIPDVKCQDFIIARLSQERRGIQYNIGSMLNSFFIENISVKASMPYGCVSTDETKLSAKPHHTNGIIIHASLPIRPFSGGTGMGEMIGKAEVDIHFDNNNNIHVSDIELELLEQDKNMVDSIKIQLKKLENVTLINSTPTELRKAEQVAPVAGEEEIETFVITPSSIHALQSLDNEAKQIVEKKSSNKFVNFVRNNPWKTAALIGSVALGAVGLALTATGIFSPVGALLTALSATGIKLSLAGTGLLVANALVPAAVGAIGIGIMAGITKVVKKIAGREKAAGVTQVAGKEKTAKSPSSSSNATIRAEQLNESTEDLQGRHLPQIQIPPGISIKRDPTFSNSNKETFSRSPK